MLAANSKFEAAETLFTLLSKNSAIARVKLLVAARRLEFALGSWFPILSQNWEFIVPFTERDHQAQSLRFRWSRRQNKSWFESTIQKFANVGAGAYLPTTSIWKTIFTLFWFVILQKSTLLLGRFAFYVICPVVCVLVHAGVTGFLSFLDDDSSWPRLLKSACTLEALSCRELCLWIYCMYALNKNFEVVIEHSSKIYSCCSIGNEFQWDLSSCSSVWQMRVCVMLCLCSEVKPSHGACVHF